MVVGCATPQPAQDPVPLAFSQALPDSLPAEPVQLEMFAADKATASNEPYGVPNDSLIGTMLETARQHYLSATAAAANGDSLRSAVQFEEAISLLDELSVIPDIDSNKDFADLSRAVVEDYELYIARIDSLSPETSISALREKMNQVADLSDTASLGPQKTIVQGTTVPLVMNTMVERNIEFFTGRGRMHMERWIKNSGRYFPLLKKILQQERVPEELVHLCMIESGVNPNARSWARAVGMWQFVKGTGRLYGLRALMNAAILRRPPARLRVICAICTRSSGIGILCFQPTTRERAGSTPASGAPVPRISGKCGAGSPGKPATMSLNTSRQRSSP